VAAAMIRQQQMFGPDPIKIEPKNRASVMSRVWRICREHPEALENYHLLLFEVWIEDGLLMAAQEGFKGLRDFFQQRATNHATIGRAYRKCKEAGYIREPKATRLRRRRAENQERERWRG